MTTVGAGVSLAELDADPYPVYARLRRTEPVCWVRELGRWLVTTWPEANRVLTDPELFTSDIPDSRVSRLCGGTPILQREGADHRELRDTLCHDYDPLRVTEYVGTVVRPHAERIAARLRPAGRAELAADYFEPVSVHSEASLLGLGPAGAHSLRECGNALVAAAVNLSQDGREVAALADLDPVGPVIASLRRQPNESIISHLIHARPDHDVLPTLRQLSMSALTPGWLAGWTLLALLSRPEQLAEVLADRRLLDAAVYEALRWSAPVGILARRTTAPVCLGAKEIPAGTVVTVSIASANRDAAAFPNADEFDLHRPVRTHLGFGAGPHACPAYSYVVAVARTALDVLFDRMPGLRPDTEWWPAPHGWLLRPPGPIAMRWKR